MLWELQQQQALSSKIWQWWRPNNQHYEMGTMNKDLQLSTFREWPVNTVSERWLNWCPDITTFMQLWNSCEDSCLLFSLRSPLWWRTMLKIIWLYIWSGESPVERNDDTEAFNFLLRRTSVAKRVCFEWKLISAPLNSCRDVSCYHTGSIERLILRKFRLSLKVAE